MLTALTDNPALNTALVMQDVYIQDGAWRTHLVNTYGVKAIHADDGNVDREKNYVFLAYPTLNTQPQVGDLIALGTPPTFRLVRVTRVENHPARLTFYHFEPTGEVVLPPEK